MCKITGLNDFHFDFKGFLNTDIFLKKSQIDFLLFPGIFIIGKDFSECHLLPAFRVPLMKFEITTSSDSGVRMSVNRLRKMTRILIVFSFFVCCGLRPQQIVAASDQE